MAGPFSAVGPIGTERREEARLAREQLLGEPYADPGTGPWRSLQNIASRMPFFRHFVRPTIDRPFPPINVEGMPAYVRSRYDEMVGQDPRNKALLALRSPELMANKSPEEFDKWLLEKSVGPAPTGITLGENEAYYSLSPTGEPQPLLERSAPFGFNVLDKETGDSFAVTRAQFAALVEKAPGRFEVVRGTERAPSRPFAVTDKPTGKTVLVTAEEYAKQPDRYGPPPKSTKPTDPLVEAKREADLRWALRREAMSRRGLQEIPGFGLYDTKTKQPAEILPELLSEINEEINQGVATARGTPEKAATAGESPEEPAAEAPQASATPAQVEVLTQMLKAVLGMDPTEDQKKAALKAAGFKVE